MRFVFLHMSSMEFNGDSLGEKPLGGTETALIGLSQALAKDLKNNVHVFTNTAREQIFSGVHYHPLQTFLSWAQGQVMDVMISIRQWIPLVLPVQARYRVYFSPDAHDQPALHHAFPVRLNLEGKMVDLPLFAPRDFMPFLDEVFCVGDWQAGTFVQKLGFPKERMHVMGNGIFPQNFLPKSRNLRCPEILYSSTPFRGLEHLVRIFPEIQKEVHEARLRILSSMRVYGVDAEEDQKIFGALYERIKAVGGGFCGSVPQHELAQILCSGMVFAYPNTFDETFCISVLEAQAAGLPVVTSARAALLERVEHGVDGFLVEGDPAGDSYQKEFSKHVVALFQDEALWQRMSLAGQKKAARHTYDELAKQWNNHFLAKNIPARKASFGVWLDICGPSACDMPHPLDPRRRVRLDVESLKHFLTEYRSFYDGKKYVEPN